MYLCQVPADEWCFWRDFIMKILFSPLGMRDPINLEGFGKGRNDGIDNWGTEGSRGKRLRDCQLRIDHI